MREGGMETKEKMTKDEGRLDDYEASHLGHGNVL
jgi:hypothetical protein